MQFPERRGRLVVRPRLRLAEERIGLLADERIISGMQLAEERGGLVIRKERRRGRRDGGAKGEGEDGRFTYSSRSGASGRSGSNLPLVVVVVAPDAISGENYARSRSASSTRALAREARDEIASYRSRELRFTGNRSRETRDFVAFPLSGGVLAKYARYRSTSERS